MSQINIPLENLQRLINLCNVKKSIINSGLTDLINEVNKQIKEYEDTYHFAILNDRMVSDSNELL